MSDTSKFFLLAGFVVMVLCMAGYGIGVAVGVIPTTTTNEIRMVQPCGQVWCADKDAHYAEHVNEPNSQANKNNSEANYYDAVATKTVAEAQQAEATALALEARANVIPNCIGGILLLAAIFVGGGVLAWVMSRIVPVG